MKLHRLTSAFQVAVRAALAAGLSVLLAQLCRFEHPIYALIAAVIVTDLSPSRTTKLGLQRLAATVVGASCGAVAGTILGAAAWAIGLSIFVAMATCHLLRVPDGAKVAGYICGIVMIAHGTHPWTYAFSRLIETSLGIGVAWLLSLVPKLIHVEEPGIVRPGSDSSQLVEKSLMVESPPFSQKGAKGWPPAAG